MNNQITALLEKKSYLPAQEFVSEALGILECGFRKMVLSLLGEAADSEIRMKSMYPEIAALQRPSWGCWNGLLLGLLKARRSILNTGTLAERESIGRCRGLASVADDMELSVAIEDKRIMEILETTGYLSVSHKRASIVKARELFAIPIFFRNRIAHDNIQDAAWWEDTAHVLSYLLQWYAGSTFARYDSSLSACDPWLFEESGEFWCYNGISTDKSESIVHYVSISGKNKVDRDRAGKVLLGFKKLLGEEELQEANFNRLLGRLSPEEVKGFILGGYIVGEKAGEGGFADVYKGIQLSTGRKVAIKVLKTGLSDSDKLRFLHEAEYLSMFDHPNIARIFEYNEQPWRKSQLYDLSEEEWFREFRKNHGSVLTYITMEWIEGKNLDDMYKDLLDNKMSVAEKELAKWFCEAAGALELIHNANLIHRDITPKNIMVTESGTVKLMDFGISRTQYDNRTVVTSHGKMLGSEPYMSPEQLDYERAKNELGPRSDIYSLGGTFYELFTHKRLYDHNNDAVSIATASTMKMRGERPASPLQLNSSLSWEISTILMGCLENEPGDRYQTAHQLKEDILRYLEDLPIEYKKPGFTRRLQLMYRRNARTVRLTGAFVLLAIVMTSVYIYKIENSNHQLTQLNGKLTDQISLTEQQRKIALENETEAVRQQKAAEENARLAALNEKTALDNLDEAQRQKALAQSNEKLALDNETLALQNEEKATASMLLAKKNEKAAKEQRDTALENQSRYLAGLSDEELASGNRTLAIRLALAALPKDITKPDRPFVMEAMSALTKALADIRPSRSILQLDNLPDSVAVSSNGEYIVTKTSSEYNSIRVWKISSGKEAETFKDLRSNRNNSCVSDDGNTIAVIDAIESDGTAGSNSSYVARIYDVNTGKLINTINIYGNFYSCYLSPKGNVLILQNSGSRTLLHVKSGRTIAKDMTAEILFSPDEKFAIEYHPSKLSDYTVTLFDTNSSLSDMTKWKVKGTTLVSGKPVHVIYSGNSGKIAFSMQTSGMWLAEIYDTNSLANTSVFKIRTDSISSMAFSDNGKYLALGLSKGTVIIGDAGTGNIIRQVVHEGPTYNDPSSGENSKTAILSNIVFSRDASSFFTSSYSGNVKRWDTQSGVNLDTYHHEGYVHQAVLTPDQKKIVSISLDKTARVWNIDPEGKSQIAIENTRYYGTDGINMYAKLMEDGWWIDPKYKAYNISNGSVRYGTPYIDTVEQNTAFGLSKKPVTSEKTVTIPDRTAGGTYTGAPGTVFNINGIVTSACMNADESLMAVSYIDNSSHNIAIELSDMATRKVLHRWEIPYSGSRRSDVNFTPDEKKLIVCKINDNKTWDMYVFSTIDYSQVHYSIRGKYPNYLIGRDSQTIYAAENTNDNVVIREVTSGRTIVSVENDNGWRESYVYFSLSGDLAVVYTSRQEGAGNISAGNFVYECFDLKTGKSLFRTTESTNYIGQIAFSSNGRFVAIHTLGEKFCRLWDINSGTKTEIPPAAGHIVGLAFTPDSDSLIIAENSDNTKEPDYKTYFIKYKLYSSQEALSIAKALLEDTELTQEEKVRYFVSEGTGSGLKNSFIQTQN